MKENNILTEVWLHKLDISEQKKKKFHGESDFFCI